MTDDESRNDLDANEIKPTLDLNGSVLLVSKDLQEFEVSRSSAELSGFIRSMTEEWSEEDAEEWRENKMPMDKVDSQTLTKVISFLDYHAKNPLKPISRPIKSNEMSKIVDQEWYAKFIDEMDKPLMYNVILAANYMDIHPLLDLGCCKIATYLFGKKKREIPAVFGVSGDFTPEDEARVYENHPWVKDLRDNVFETEKELLDEEKSDAKNSP